jgi:hypothetical protein
MRGQEGMVRGVFIAAQALQAVRGIIMEVHAESPDTFPLDTGKDEL